MGFTDSPPFCRTDGCDQVPQVYIKGSFRCPACAVKIQMNTFNRIEINSKGVAKYQGKDQ
jgi:hypothetical protein